MPPDQPLHPDQPLRPDATWNSNGQRVRGDRDQLSGAQVMLRSVSRAALRIARFAAIVGIATFLTGLSIFEGTGRPKWIVIGGLICVSPASAGVLAAWRMRRAAASDQQIGAPLNPEVRALATLPRLAVIALFGTLCVGALGTILFIGAVID